MLSENNGFVLPWKKSGFVLLWENKVFRPSLDAFGSDCGISHTNQTNFRAKHKQLVIIIMVNSKCPKWLLELVTKLFIWYTHYYIINYQFRLPQNITVHDFFTNWKNGKCFVLLIKYQGQGVLLNTTFWTNLLLKELSWYRNKCSWPRSTPYSKTLSDDYQVNDGKLNHIWVLSKTKQVNIYHRDVCMQHTVRNSK